MKILTFALDVARVGPFGECAQAFPAIDYTGDMLQRTTGPLIAPERLDYVVVERVARDMRNRYIASPVRAGQGRLGQPLGASCASGHRTCPMKGRPAWEGANLVGRFFRRLVGQVYRLERQRREAYLASATDIYDLERRMRELERPTSLSW